MHFFSGMHAMHLMLKFKITNIYYLLLVIYAIITSNLILIDATITIVDLYRLISEFKMIIVQIMHV